jgi:hypothetical protein
MTLNASYTVAKTLAANLAKNIAFLEEKTGQTIMTVEQVSGAIMPKST